ncbi:MAG: response regulator [bacterium]
MKILVIDNDININGLIKSVLDLEKNYEVDFVLSGKEGLRKMKKVKYDLILLDLTMPEVSGVDIIKFMTADDELKDVPVIIVSAMPIFSKDFQEANDNFQDYEVIKDMIEKPFDIHDLLNKIKSATSKK